MRILTFGVKNVPWISDLALPFREHKDIGVRVSEFRSARLGVVRRGPPFVRLQQLLASWIISGDPPEPGSMRRLTMRRAWLPYFESLALIALITFIGLHIEKRIAPTNVAMLYLLAVVVSAVR